MKKSLKYLSVLFLGFIGGCLAPMFFSLFINNPINSLDQAVSIANTYIVFTTIFFVGITVLLSIGGYVISQQLTTTRKQLEKDATEQLLKRIRYSESLPNEVLKAILSNNDFKNGLEQSAYNYVDNAIKKQLEASAQTANAKSQEIVLENKKIESLATLLSEMQKNRSSDDITN